MENRHLNKAFLLKAATLAAFVILYILFEKLYFYLYSNWPSNPDRFPMAYSVLVRFIQWGLLGILFYLLAQKEKPVFLFSMSYFILFLTFTFIWFSGGYGFYFFKGDFFSNQFHFIYLKFFPDKYNFLNFILPALSGFFLMQSLFSPQKPLKNEPEKDIFLS